MIVTSIVLPAMLAARTADMMRGLFLCFAFALILNVFFVLGGSPTIVMYGSKLVNIGYQGYFEGKNYLGECAAVAFLLSFHEMLYPGWRRALGIIVVVIAILLVFLSNSKTAFGLALNLSVPGWTYVDCQKDNAHFSGDNSIVHTILLHRYCPAYPTSTLNRISYMLYGDSTFTGRTIIWDFAQSEIERSPLVGWGYQSFWLVGPTRPAR